MLSLNERSEGYKINAKSIHYGSGGSCDDEAEVQTIKVKGYVMMKAKGIDN